MDALNDCSDPESLQSRLSQVRAISQSYCIAEGGSHGPDHTERVFTVALAMGKQLGADLLVLGTAALLHDVGRKEESLSKGRICHAQKGAEIARELLPALNFHKTEIEKVCHCIRSHRYRKGDPPSTLEAQILFDADKLDSIGAIGIGRAFLFAGQMGAKLHNPEMSPEESEAYSTEDTAYREFQVKMSRVKEQMLTVLGQKLATERHHFMETYFAQLHREIYGIEHRINQLG
ncbi:HD domain-containing protein [Desulfogranum japonicum]|uniref:HD domain-containing protein n=1 Tax=Desulfogranum japonicum TaxID=231447 RepID=UPI0004283635|nr:HD domain-containing protein [Desulfogranum japonicum]